jgi:diacylglycerol O-acyltransferase / wax synthase
MSLLDSAFLQVEDGITHMHIGSIARFEGPAPRFSALVDLIERKLPLLPRYRQRVRLVPGRIGRPVWVDDPHFNLRYHVRHTALPPPGLDSDVRNLMGRLMSQQLDRERPLWETWVVEGFDDGTWAIISKVHHCMVDGISGTDLMTVLLDDEPDAKLPPLKPWEPEPEPTDARVLGDALVGLATAPLHQARAAGTFLRNPRRLGDMAKNTVSGLSSYGRHLTSTKPLSIEGAIGPHRCWDQTSVELDDVKRVRENLGGTVNDVLLSLATAGFRDLLLARGDDLEHIAMHTLVPVSVRAPDDHSPNNQVTAIVATLPVDLTDTKERFDTVKRQMAEMKTSHQAEAGSLLMSTLEVLAPPVVLAAALRGGTALLRRLPQYRVNTVTTNVPGPRHALFALGREMLEYLPFVPISQGVRVGVAMLSYNGRVAFGVTGDWDSVPDLDPMMRGIEQEMHKLLRLSAAVERKRKSRHD